VQDNTILNGVRPLKAGLLGASFGTKNLGVAALTCGTVASFCYSFPNGSIFLLDYGRKAKTFRIAHSEGIGTVELVNIRFSKNIILDNNIAYLLLLSLILKIIPSRHLRVRLLEGNHVLKTIWNADLFGAISGGDSFSDIYGIGRLIYVALPQILIIILGKPLVLLPQTLGPFKGTFAKAIARYILKRSMIVYSRDRSGLETVKGLVGRDCRHLTSSYDMGFALKPAISKDRIPIWCEKFDKNNSLIGINVSGLLYMGGYTRKNMFGIKTDYTCLILNIIAMFLEKYNAHVMLIPHVFGTGKDSESDVIACRNIYNNTNNMMRSNVHFVEEEYNQHEIKALIGRSDFFLGSRMHACIAAISQCIPTVGLAYSRKFYGVFESVGIEDLVIDMRNLDGDAIINKIMLVYQNRQDISKKLEEVIPSVNASVHNMFKRIINDYGKRE